MSDGGRSNVAPWVVLGVAVCVFLGWAVAPASTLYSSVLTPHRLLVLASLLKLVYLLAGAALAFACRDRLEPGNPARPAWFLVSLGLLATFAGQLCLAPFQIALNQTPFPSVADMFYLLAYPLLIAALIVLLRAYREAGLPVGSTAERVGIVVAVGLVAAFLVGPILKPVVTTDGPLLDRVITVAYPFLDLVLLMPLAVLLRITLHLRGSHAGEVWMLLLSGFTFVCVADIGFAYFQALGEAHLDPYVHATFVLAYGLIAGGAHRQYQLLRS
jgi:hypothetical protein